MHGSIAIHCLLPTRSEHHGRHAGEADSSSDLGLSSIAIFTPLFVASYKVALSTAPIAATMSIH